MLAYVIAEEILAQYQGECAPRRSWNNVRVVYSVMGQRFTNALCLRHAHCLI
jgi:hypothetical protein